MNPNPAAGYSSIVDAWSIGVVLWCCLTNQTPFDETESEPLALRMRSRQVDMSVPQSLGVSDVAIDFLRKLLNPDPRFRMSCCAFSALLYTVEESVRYADATVVLDSSSAQTPLADYERVV